jgi:hypothetical protein
MIITDPDKYERWAGIDDVRRHWKWNNRHQCWKQSRNYNLGDLTKIYHLGYRDAKFRGETIEEAFKKIQALPYGKSENKYRIRWFLDHFDGRKLLDIGSGLGVFPHELRTHGWIVEATEENLTSKNFIRNELGMPCNTNADNFDVISIIHVLEHIENIGDFLEYHRGRLGPNGRVFIEVPDAVEFDYLPKGHDEFNSCHIWFFDVSSLYRTVSRYFDVNDIHRVRHKETDRSRIMLSATSKF